MSNQGTSDPVKILEDVFNVKITPSSTQATFPPNLPSIHDQIQSSTGVGLGVDFRNLVPSICFEIVSQHVEGRLRDIKYTGNDSDVKLKDINSFMTYWFLDTLDRAYLEERNYPKVVKQEIILLFLLYKRSNIY